MNKLTLVAVLMCGLITMTNACSGGSGSDPRDGSSPSSTSSTCGVSDDTGETSVKEVRPQGPGRFSQSSRIAPWFAFVKVANVEKPCFGVVIQAQWVATQWSCLQGAAAGSITVGVGRPAPPAASSGSGDAASQSTSDSGTARPVPQSRLWVNVANVYQNPSYNSASGAYDVALLKLSSALDLTQTDIKVICLPTDSTTCTQKCQMHATTGTARHAGWQPQGNRVGGLFTQTATVFRATIDACTAAATTSTEGAAVLTVSVDESGNDNPSGKQYACLFPNGRAAVFTFVCCILDWINTTIAANS